MKVFLLDRFRESFGTYGTLYNFDGVELCKTFELPWLNNNPDVSCIPEGEYVCTVEYHAQKGRVFRLHDVPGRSGILIHRGNTLKDTTGCILVGLYHNRHGVVKSVFSMGKLLIYLPDTFLLKVVNSISKE